MERVVFANHPERETLAEIMDNAIQLYEKLGFVKSGEQDGILNMELNLKNSENC